MKNVFYIFVSYGLLEFERMFDHFTIFTKAGIVLYSKSFLKLVGSPVEKIINTIFLEGKESENVYHYNQYAMKWTMANDLGLIFVVVYQKILQILFMNDLLDKVKERFIEKYRNEIPGRMYELYEYNKLENL